MAPAATLHHVTDTGPGITRKKRGKHYHYYTPQNERITAEAEIKRINALAIPPAYKNVWICPTPHGHIQATGIDAKGRKQYRYHPQWRQERDRDKFAHILRFGEKLPQIRARVDEDMRRSGLPREKVLATVVQLLEKTLIRVGNEQYAKQNHSYGLSTLQNRHVKVKGAHIAFNFMGKSGKRWNLSMDDRRIAAVIKRCADIPGHELFKYVDEAGHTHDVTSGDINHYLQSISGEEFTAKDFRTWSGTVLAGIALQEFEKYDSAAQAKKNVLRAIENVSKRLGNTPAICRKCYIHPEVLTAYLDGDFALMAEHEIDDTFRRRYDRLSQEEILVLAFLHRRLHRLAQSAKH